MNKEPPDEKARRSLDCELQTKLADQLAAIESAIDSLQGFDTPEVLHSTIELVKQIRKSESPNKPDEDS